MQQQHQMMPNMPLIQPPRPTTPQTVNNSNIIRNLTQFPGEFSYTCAQ
jgi:hypothetical protein